MDETFRIKSFQAQSIKAVDTTNGIVELIASVFGNVDSYGERIMQGFFDDSITNHRSGAFTVKGLYMHDWYAPIANTLEMRALNPHDPLLPDNIKENGGLYVKGQFNLETQIGRETYSNVTKGILDQYSVGITVTEERSGADGITELVKGKLWEWSSVLFGANDMTTTLSAKTLGLQKHIQSVRTQAKSAVTLANSLEPRLMSRIGMRELEGRKLSSATVTEVLTTADEGEEIADEMIEQARALKISVQRLRDLVENSQPSNDKALMMMAQSKHLIATANY